MVSIEKLKEFCGIGSILSRPFSFGEWTCFTDGHIAILIDRIDDIPFNALIQHDTEEAIFKMYKFDPKNIKDWFKLDESFIKSLTGKKVTCDKCGGRKKIVRCPDCNGYGEVRWTSNGGYDYEANCKMCDGTGHVSTKEYPSYENRDCDKCNATGEVEHANDVELCGKLFNDVLLKKILTLGDVSFNVEYNKDSLAPIAFKFDGGYGILMVKKRS